MRIIKELTIEGIHIAIFKMEQKYSLKLEWDRMEQVYKLDTRDGVEELDHVLALIDKTFIHDAKMTFANMNRSRVARLKVLHEMEQDGEEFPEII